MCVDAHKCLCGSLFRSCHLALSKRARRSSPTGLSPIRRPLPMGSRTRSIDAYQPLLRHGPPRRGISMTGLAGGMVRPHGGERPRSQVLATVGTSDALLVRIQATRARAQLEREQAERTRLGSLDLREESWARQLERQAWSRRPGQFSAEAGRERPQPQRPPRSRSACLWSSPQALPGVAAHRFLR
jgi:hypothetical protein